MLQRFFFQYGDVAGIFKKRDTDGKETATRVDHERNAIKKIKYFQNCY